MLAWPEDDGPAPPAPHGNFPVIVTGGIYDHAAIRRFFAVVADGV